VLPTAERPQAAEPAPDAVRETDVDELRDAARHQARRRKERRVAWTLVLPTLVILVLALGYPVGWQLVTSFRKYGLKQQFGKPPEWVGLENYKNLVTDPSLWAVVVRSIVFCVIVAFATVVIGGLMALLMQRVPRGPRIVLQVSLLLAWAMPVVAAMTIWIWIVDWRRGLLNWLLVNVGFEDAEGHNWLAQPLSFFIVAGVIVIWMSVPFVALSIYAGLTQVSGEVLEAAQLDGASGWQRLRYVILPLIAPVFSIVLLLQLIWDLRVFTQIKMLQDAGGVANETNLLGTFIYQLGTGKGDFGMSSAVSVVMLLLTVALSWYYVRSLMKEEAS
jgi:N,N'-diacetylchitobiose transport system permease protein